MFENLVSRRRGYVSGRHTVNSLYNWIRKTSRRTGVVQDDTGIGEWLGTSHVKMFRNQLRLKITKAFHKTHSTHPVVLTPVSKFFANDPISDMASGKKKMAILAVYKKPVTL